MATPQNVADWFLNRLDRDAGEAITHLQLQKLLYYAQAWALVMLGQPLFEEEFQAWTHGPVLRSIFDKYKGNGWNALPASDHPPYAFTEEQTQLLNDVADVYGKYSAKALERMTHADAPWRDARGNLPAEARCEAIISREAIQKFYRDLLENVEQEEA